MPEFSIIIPVFKAEKTIRRCVESIEKNTFQDFEIILIEDGSKDKSWKICQDLAHEYENIVALHNDKNKGVSYTRNRGIEVASGRYILFVDGDDWVEQDYCSSFYNIISEYQPAITVCGYINHDEKQNKATDLFCWKDSTENDIIDFMTNIMDLYELRLLQQLWNKAFMTSIIKENNICFDESISLGEDFRFILGYLKVASPALIYVINKGLYHYMRDQDGSLMYRVGYESVDEPLKNLRLLYEVLEYPEQKIMCLLAEERRKHIESYAYMIMHNAGMTWKEKKRLIHLLDINKGKSLYKKNRNLLIKERVAQFFKSK